MNYYVAGVLFFMASAVVPAPAMTWVTPDSYRVFKVLFTAGQFKKYKSKRIVNKLLCGNRIFLHEIL